MMGAVPSLGLPRERRIKQGRDFARTKTQGKRVYSGCLIANWLTLPAGSPTRLGVITSRKVGAAVARSRARRLLREAFRVHQFELAQPVDLVLVAQPSIQLELAQPVDLVLVAQPSIAGKAFQDVERDFLGAMRKARLLKETA
jgi:ribonuclease P protein component